MEALAVANRELRREIVRRQAVEEALRQSEQHQPVVGAVAPHAGSVAAFVPPGSLTQEEERKRISRELHDEITQTLVGINVQLEASDKGGHE